MEFKAYSRKPFNVEAVQITDETFDDVFDMIGKEIKTSADGDKVIVIDRRIVPTVTRAFKGFWVTRMGDNIRCYPDKVFTEQFEVTSEDSSERV